MHTPTTTSALPLRFSSLDGQKIDAILGGGQALNLPELSSSTAAFVAWTCFQQHPSTWIWVTDGARSMEKMQRDLQALAPEAMRDDLISFPAWEALPTEDAAARPEITGHRLRALLALQEGSHRLVVTCVQALMQRTFPVGYLKGGLKELTVGTEVDLAELTELLEQRGYEFVYEVQNPGEACGRGGLLDLWPPTEDQPLRLEFFGDELESIRSFDPAEQRSIEKLAAFTLAPAEEWDVLRQSKRPPNLCAYLPDHCSWAWVGMSPIRDHAKLYEEAFPVENKAQFISTWAQLRKKTATFSGATLACAPGIWPKGRGAKIDLPPGEGLPNLEEVAEHPDLIEAARRDFLEQRIDQATNGHDVALFFDTEGALQRFRELYGKHPGIEQLHLRLAPLSEGFSYPTAKIIAVAESELFGYRKRGLRRSATQKRRQKTKTAKGQALTHWSEINPGELVVHIDHGIGKYLGLLEIETSEGRQEVLAIEYAKKAKLYVPPAHAHLLSRYMGAGKLQPELHILGGTRWNKQKDAVARSVEDLAAMLLETQGAREALQGHAFGHDTTWQHEFEASFPWQETDDQLDAIHAVRDDMESTKPMDRLICGDVGYGKTEVAMRAAFKAVMDGKQVAILVPTTVLAQQHFHSFSERMAAFPVSIEMLSRFRSRAEQTQILKRVKAGQVDIVIGTHRIVQPDVAFSDLGLVIIDEEQRFGVTHKERLKQLRRMVDVLTLTATPIPRTLYMSLVGAKDLSTIQTAPRERLPIETIIEEHDDDVIRKAIITELNREGQVFFLHNRVKTIYSMQQKLKKLVPEARILVGHGQMGEHELSDVMQQFIEAKADVLLCTTIIESGVDIPNVNTILIDRADRFGVAALYQLRGRVGRYKHKAYAYLLLPKGGRLVSAADERIRAIRRYSGLGAGFKLALQDLEIRGAGNILGSQQSGHIAAVGFDLYCQLLRQAVAAAKGEKPPRMAHVEMQLTFLQLSPHATGDAQAALPYTYIEEEGMRVRLYRRIAALVEMEEITALREELRDRFGPPPQPVERLLKIATIRIQAAERDVAQILTKKDQIQISRYGDFIQFGGRFPRFGSDDPDERLTELEACIKSLP